MVHSNRVEFGVFWIRREEKERRTPKGVGKGGKSGPGGRKTRKKSPDKTAIYFCVRKNEKNHKHMCQAFLKMFQNN